MNKISEKDQAPPFMRLFHANFTHDTSHLDHESVGIYMRLILWYWAQQKPLKASRVLGFLGLDQHNSSKALAVLDEYYTLVDGYYHHAFLDREISDVKSFREKKKQAGAAGGKKKAENAKAKKDKEKQTPTSKDLANASTTKAKVKQTSSKPLAKSSDKDKDKDIKTPQTPKGALVESEFDKHFEKFWNAGMRKDGKKEAKAKMRTILAKHKGQEAAFIDKLCQDIQKRIAIGQTGFDALHPKTYLNNERWNDSYEPPGGIQTVFDQPEKEGSFVAKHSDTSWREGLPDHHNDTSWALGANSSPNGDMDAIEGEYEQLGPDENQPPIEAYGSPED